MRCNVRTCRNCDYDITDTFQSAGEKQWYAPNYKSASYYEVWFVAQGTKRAKFFEFGQAMDSNKLKYLDGHCGAMMTTTEIRFYCMKDTGDLGGIGPNSKDLSDHARPSPHFPKAKWGKRKVIHPPGAVEGCSISGLDLPVSLDEPDWWQDKEPVEGLAGQSNTVSFNCCARDNKPLEKGCVRQTWGPIGGQH
jgi:hypothetical protein